MDIPKFDQTFLPILDILSDQKEIHYQELKQKVLDKFYGNLPKELLEQKTNKGEPLLLNRIGWGTSYLKAGKFIERPRRAYLKITDKGLETLHAGVLTLAQLKKDKDYLQTQLDKAVTQAPIELHASHADNTPQDLIDIGFRTIKTNVRADLLERLKSIDPFYFEKVILILLKRMGYGEFIETKKSGDGGIDGIMNQDQLGLNKIYIQAKRYTESKVRETDIRNFIGAMSGDTTNGVFVTTSSFDDAAVKKAKEAHHKIILIDGHRLTDLMFEYGVGVQTVNTYEMKTLDEDFFEMN